MDIDACIKKIDRHLAKDFVQPIIVDVQNRSDLSELIEHYRVKGNDFVTVSQYCNTDEYPNMENLLHDLRLKNGRIFVTGFSAFLKLQGEKFLRNTLDEILGMSPSGSVVLISYQCRQYLNYRDPRLIQRVSVIDGTLDEMQSFVFVAPELVLPRNVVSVSGVHCIGDAVESITATKLYVNTKKQKSDFPDSIFFIDAFDSAFDILAQRYNNSGALCEGYGSREQWNYALSKLEKKKKWADLIDSEFGNHMTLDIAFPGVKTSAPDRQWLYFIALKLFGAKNNWCLNETAKKASSIKDFAKQAYRSLLDIPRERSDDFEGKYLSRKELIANLGNPTDEVVDYCRLVQGKGKEAIYYLTDNTQNEKELIFELLDRYADDYTEEQVCSALKLIYPDLYKYLSPYHFGNDFLDRYFQMYKYQKVINHILPEFKKMVTEQAKKREYNLLLGPRSSIIESIDRTDAQLYFVDAMGVEYLSYITSVCNELNLMANITVCRCELPSLTGQNKKFIELFENKPFPIVSIKDIDEIKHKGKDNFDYQQTKLPIHLIKELEILRTLLEQVKACLASGKIKKAVLVADHGASRLAVIHGTECFWKMPASGEHSGRCCLKTDVDTQPEYATDAGDFWVLANYDRFKGGRRASVEVHGGATLEEIAVPIIELTYRTNDIDVYLLPLSATSISLDGIPEISVSFRKKAAIKIFATAKLQNVSIAIDGKSCDAVPKENGFYEVEMAHIKRAKTYSVDVYAGGNCIAKGLPLKVKKEGSSERDLL